MEGKAVTAGEVALLTLLGGALVLGLRHGIDWDHIAAILDIAGTTVTVAEADVEQPAVVASSGQAVARASQTVASLPAGAVRRKAFWLAFLYAAGHGLVVILLGLLALVFRIILPDWVDPVLERVVGATLVLLGGWILYSLVAYARGRSEFRLRSRWMLLFAGVRRASDWLRARVSGRPHDTEHHHVDQYGWRTAMAVGALHGIGAETGTQVLLIAAIGGGTNVTLGVAMLLAFVLGLIVSNSVIALLAVTSFANSARFRLIYLVIGAMTALLSLVIGGYFLLGLSSDLPDLFHLTGFLGGPAEE